MKKIISLVLACMLLFSVSAFADSYATIEMSEPELVSGDNGDYYAIKINVPQLPEFVIGGDYRGYNAYQIYIDFDETKLDVGYTATDWLGNATTDYADIFVPVMNMSNGKAVSFEHGDDKTSYNEGLLKIVNDTSASGVFCSKIINGTKEVYTIPTTELGNVYFTPKAGATGKAEVTFSLVEFSGTNNVAHRTADGTITAIGTTIDLGGEEEPEEPEEPVATTVKTFAKRLYIDNVLYTVGVISEGTNYATETIKAGIRIDKAGVMVPYWTNNAPVSDGKGTSYYAVALNGVTAETDIKAESVSKAVITVNGGAEISGDEVSANDTSVE